MLYSVIVPAFCILGIGTGMLIIAFSVRNFFKKQYRLFSAIYAVVTGLVLTGLIRMLHNTVTGFACARNPAVTVLIYLGIDVLLMFILSDTVFAGKKPKRTGKSAD